MARRLVHLSDLHFGRVNWTLVEPLLASVRALSPHVVAISGDLTQRALPEQFADARSFIDRLGAPVVVVPGNHDISMWNVLRRFLAPLRRYRKYISHDAEPTWQDEELFVLGLNSARSLTIKEGRLSRHQLAHARRHLEAAGSDRWKVVLLHHPFFEPEGGTPQDIVGGRDRALAMLHECGADVLLAGHLHRSWSRNTPEVHRLADRTLLAVQAGSAISTRLRGEKNSFNVVDLGEDGASVTIHSWDPDKAAFAAGMSNRYVQRGTWIKLASQPAGAGA